MAKLKDIYTKGRVRHKDWYADEFIEYCPSYGTYLGKNTNYLCFTNQYDIPEWIEIESSNLIGWPNDDWELWQSPNSITFNSQQGQITVIPPVNLHGKTYTVTPGTNIITQQAINNRLYGIPPATLENGKIVVHKECHHEFKIYNGLNETYEYCCKCDEKKS